MQPKLMGVLNVTPDSFYDESRCFAYEQALERGCLMWQEGADLLDIGGASSRPFADVVEEAEELRRVIPVIETLAKLVPIPISIDTYQPVVAKAAIAKGATLINDISGFTNPKMVEVAKECAADLCIVHMRGTPQTMQINPLYPEGIISHLLAFFEDRIEQLTHEGIDAQRIILDPGIGFGKTVEDTLQIFKNLPKFKKFGLRILIGASRKSFLTKLLNKPATELLPATLAIHTMALLAGVDMIRVHDVAPHRDVINVITPNLTKYF